MSLYIDLTEFLTNPITTGIQRIAGELCKYMPSDAAIPVRLHNGAYHALPAELIDAIGRYFSNPEKREVAAIQRLGIANEQKRLKVAKGDTVLVPEVIIEPRRLKYLASVSDEEFECHRFIVYDLLPITHPELFNTDWMVEICEYYRVLRRASHCAFISEATRNDFYGRLRRTHIRDGVVLPLGSDGLGNRSAQPARRQRSLHFSVLGTIEPRKNHKLILEAFEPLLRGIPGLSLTFIGKMGWVEPLFANKVTGMAADPKSGFRFRPAPDDETARREIEDSRATLYLSLAEGYGLPPVESLWIGTPVIASRTIPSLNLLNEGIHYVDSLDAVTLRRAILLFLDDTYAQRKAEEAANLELPTWRNFAREALAWCGSDKPAAYFAAGAS
jgi:glycosyltransferase involved in cell wall biosynthesis